MQLQIDKEVKGERMYILKGKIIRTNDRKTPTKQLGKTDT